MLPLWSVCGWIDADFDFADMMLEGEGIVHMCHCFNCGAQIEYYVPIKEESDEDIQR